MLRFFTPHRLVQLFVSLLCIGVLATNLFYSIPVTHAASSPPPDPNVVQGPPIQCLDVEFSTVGGQHTVAVSSPPGGGVSYQHTVYVTNNAPCPNNVQVTNIQVVSQVAITCPSGSLSPQPAPLRFNGPYGLYPGGGYGNTYGIVDYCIVYKNGVPTTSVVPVHIVRTIWAYGDLIQNNGNYRQAVTSNTKVSNVW
jgi:hypothetical protein